MFLVRITECSRDPRPDTNMLEFTLHTYEETIEFVNKIYLISDFDIEISIIRN